MYFFNIDNITSFFDNYFNIGMIDFPIGYFILPLLILKSLRTLFDKYLDHMLVKFEQDRMVQINQIFSFLATNG